MRLTLLKTCMAGIFAVLSVVPAAAQRHCRLQFTMLNSTRHVIEDVSAECHGFTRPFGNWGVESNFGGRTNSFQFAGWKWIDSLLQWNSCTIDIPREGNCGVHYNHDHNGNGACECQGSNAEYSYAGWYVYYGADCPYDYNLDGQCDFGGCKGITQFSVSNQYLELWELDDYINPDDYVGNLTVHSGCCAVTGITCTPAGATGPGTAPCIPPFSIIPPR